jgi:amino acid transporter
MMNQEVQSVENTKEGNLTSFFKTPDGRFKKKVIIFILAVICAPFLPTATLSVILYLETLFPGSEVFLSSVSMILGCLFLLLLFVIIFFLIKIFVKSIIFYRREVGGKKVIAYTLLFFTVALSVGFGFCLAGLRDI